MRIAQVWVDREIADDPEAVAIGRRLGIAPRSVASAAEVYAAVAADPDPVGRGKQTLYLTRHRGAFLKECPGTRHYTCCGYRIAHIGTYCSMDCAYCILQAYFHPPVLQYFLNHRELEAELAALFDAGVVQRIGTGEFTDSLIWERWTPAAERLLALFARQDTAVLELKSKTTEALRLLDRDHRRRTVLAWSLNTERVIRSAERGTAALGARLAAAAAAAGRGYPIAFHFDPVIAYEGAEEEYAAAAERMLDAVDPRQIVWVSLGALRFMPDLKAIIRRRFPASAIPYGEFVTGLDGKLRYVKPLRMRLLRRMARTIASRAPELCLYLCMEDDEVWGEALGFTPAERGGLRRMLDESAAARCGLTGRVA